MDLLEKPTVNQKLRQFSSKKKLNRVVSEQLYLHLYLHKSPFLSKVPIYPPMIHEIVKLFKDLWIPLWCFLKTFSVCFEIEYWIKLASRPTYTLFTCCSLFNLIRPVGVMSRMTIRHVAYYCTERVLHSVDLTLIASLNIIFFK